MDRQRYRQNLSAQQVEEYLRRFKSGDFDTSAGEYPGQHSLDDYLLERAAQALRSGQADLARRQRHHGTS